MRDVLENDPSAYFVHDELLAPLKAMYGSLMDTGDDSIANGRLLDVMRQVCLLSRTHPLPILGFLSMALSLGLHVDRSVHDCQCFQISQHNNIFSGVSFKEV